jgi:aspartyl-tRNA(Asn)/glutamyl-tRNA(Gln) amidotransferase subunit A
MAANHLDAARGRWEDVTPVPRAGLEMIDRITSADVLRAIRRRQEVLAAIAAVFDQVDLLLTPTTATPAFVAEGPPPFEIAGQRVGGMGSVPFTAPFNVSGQPAVSIPAGTTADGLPVGLQVVTRRHDEELVLAAGLVAETNRPWPKLAPSYR